MPVDEDVTPDIAEAYDDAREELAPGERYFLVRPSPWDEAGVEAIPIGADADGEITAGSVGFQPRQRGRLVLRTTETDGRTADLLSGAWGIAVLRADQAVAEVYERLEVHAPKLPTQRVWTFDLTYTVQQFTPSGAELAALFDDEEGA